MSLPVLKVAVCLALAIWASTGAGRPGEAPHPDFKIRIYVPDHRIHAEPTMGIRGNADVLRSFSGA